MADTTSHETELTRAETATVLRAIADELDSDRHHVTVAIGNKDVQLSPPETISAATTVTERSRRIRKDVEKLAVELTWHPSKRRRKSAVEPTDDGDEPPSQSETDE